MTHPLARTVAVTCVLGVIGAACASDSDGFEPGAPIPTDDSDSAAEVTATSLAESPPTSIGTTPTTTSTAATSVPEPVPTSITDVADITTQATEPESELAPTPQAPGFDFPGADLETDPDSPNNNRAVEPEDEPIVAAYLEATKAQSVMFSELPLDAQNPVLLAAPFTPELLDGFNVGVDNRTELNHVLDISEGLTSRPYVIDDGDSDPDRAIVWDCQIDATFWKDVDTGETAPPGGGYPNAGAPGVEVGTSTEMVRRDGRWLVNAGAAEPRACA